MFRIAIPETQFSFEWIEQDAYLSGVWLIRRLDLDMTKAHDLKDDWRNCGHAGLVRRGHWIAFTLGLVVGFVLGALVYGGLYPG
jgi:hypothetical protein